MTYNSTDSNERMELAAENSRLQCSDTKNEGPSCIVNKSVVKRHEHNICGPNCRLYNW